MTAIEPRAATTVTPWELLARQADVLASSAIIPRQYQGRPEDIIAAGLMGHEVGWGVMTSLQLIHVVEGKPEISAEGMVALIRRAGHSLTGTVSPEGAHVHGRRGDNGDEMTYQFTQEDAKRADLAGKTTWRRYPSSMLWARIADSRLTVPWSAIRARHVAMAPDVVADLERYGEPSTWWLSFGPIRAELA